MSFLQKSNATSMLNEQAEHWKSVENNRTFGILNSTSHTTTALLLGSGELGKEIAIELIRLGIKVCAADSYANAPAMQVAQENRVLDMSDSKKLQELINKINPNIIIPEVEAISTEVLKDVVKNKKIQVVPGSSITSIAMDREALRKIAHEKIGLPTTPYCFASSYKELEEGAKIVGYPCVVKPIMSSSGHGQSIVKDPKNLEDAWIEAQNGRRSKHKTQSLQSEDNENNEDISRVIVEALAPLDYELTVLTVCSSAGITTCEPIAQCQENGDYRQSWQPANIPENVRKSAQNIAKQAVEGLSKIAKENGETGWGIYGVELFVLKNGDLLFSELSPRPHDTGMVTMISQYYSEFALHVLAILGVPITQKHTALCLKDNEVALSHALVVQGNGAVGFTNLAQALDEEDCTRCDIRIFGKPEVHGSRRMGVILTVSNSVNDAKSCATRIASKIHTVELPS